jgi:hypothetical protein
MNWAISKIATSLMGLLGHPEKVSDSTMDNRCEDIREAMLHLLELCGTHESVQSVANKVFHARNIEALWYLRSAILAEVGTVLDQTTASEQLKPITSMFKGYLPESLAPRIRSRPASK